jgi:hypothetical protein
MSTQNEPNPALEAMCRQRLQNHARLLEEYAVCHHPRLLARVLRGRGSSEDVERVEVTFRNVRTGFRNRGTGEVEVHEVPVHAVIIPNAGESLYPFAQPMVRLRFPKLPGGCEPYLGGLTWMFGVGFPCLAREWDPRRSLVGLVVDIHRMLVVMREAIATPDDCMGTAPSDFWTSQTVYELPLEPPLEALTQMAVRPPSCAPLSLRVVEER